MIIINKECFMFLQDQVGVMSEPIAVISACWNLAATLAHVQMDFLYRMTKKHVKKVTE